MNSLAITICVLNSPVGFYVGTANYDITETALKNHIEFEIVLHPGQLKFRTSLLKTCHAKTYIMS